MYINNYVIYQSIFGFIVYETWDPCFEEIKVSPSSYHICIVSFSIWSACSLHQLYILAVTEVGRCFLLWLLSDAAQEATFVITCGPTFNNNNSSTLLSIECCIPYKRALIYPLCIPYKPVLIYPLCHRHVVKLLLLPLFCIWGTGQRENKWATKHHRGSLWHSWEYKPGFLCLNHKPILPHWQTLSKPGGPTFSTVAMKLTCSFAFSLSVV